MVSLKEKYIHEIVPKLQKEWLFHNIMEAPRIEKVVLNMGIGSYIRSWNKDFSSLKQDLAYIAWQQPVVRYARKSISNFKLKEGMPVGLMVTLRRERMYYFLERLIYIILPRIKDFRWLHKKSFDAHGNFHLWLQEHTIFPEVPQHDVVKTCGLQITIRIQSPSVDLSKRLLTEMGFLFSK